MHSREVYLRMYLFVDKLTQFPLETVEIPHAGEREGKEEGMDKGRWGEKGSSKAL